MRLTPSAAESGANRVMRSIRGCTPLAPVAFALGLFLLAIAADPWVSALQYSRPLVVQGQWWRLLTGGFVHLDVRHAAVNASAAGLLLALARRFALGCELVRNVLLGAVMVNILLLAFSPDVGFAAGLSGALHAAAVALGLRLLFSNHRGMDAAGKRMARSIGGLLLVLIGLKLYAEHAWRTPIALERWWAFPVVVAAHLAGAAAGVALAAWPWCGTSRRSGRRETHSVPAAPPASERHENKPAEGQEFERIGRTAAAGRPGRPGDHDLRLGGGAVPGAVGDGEAEAIGRGRGCGERRRSGIDPAERHGRAGCLGPLVGREAGAGRGTASR